MRNHSKAAIVRTNNENKAFTAFAVNCVIPARNGIDKTVEISVAKDGEEYNRRLYRRQESGNFRCVDFQEAWKQSLFQYVGFIGQPYRGFKRGFPSRAKCSSVERQARTSRRRQTRKARISCSSPHFLRKRVNDGFEYLWVRFLGFDREREEWLQPQTGIEAKGELELSIYNDKLNIACKVSEMSEYVKQPYNPNN